MLGTRQFKPVKRFGLFISLASLAASVAISVPGVQAQTASLIKVDGSSTVFPITEAVAEDYQNANSGTKVLVGVSGTGGGFKKFCAGEIDIANASRPIKAEEIAKCKEAGIRFMELPIAKDALTVVVSKDNTFVSSMTTEELKKLWSPKTNPPIKQWSDLRPEWPNQPITLYGPGTDSGTFEYFTESIVGIKNESRTDYTASEDDNILVQGVSRDQNALGYFGYAYYVENQERLNAVAIDSGKGPISPSVDTVNNQTYKPLSRPLFIYIAKKSLAKPEVKAFVDYYLDNAAKLSEEVGYIPLPADAYASVKTNYTANKFGTYFASKNDGLSMAEILKKSPQD
jgi:phosphate transport system substrate-binding protein